MNRRLRMFAGPNGSGKSTLKERLPVEWLGQYLNPDEIEKTWRNSGELNLASFGISSDDEAASAFFRHSPLIQKAKLDVSAFSCSKNVLRLPPNTVNSYFASVATDFIRSRLIDFGAPLSFETVMSSPDKIEILKRAQLLGYRNYLYYVATDSSEINVARVNSRVRLGGHAVPQEKIVSRYIRSLDLLFEAVQYTRRAYIFDNSHHGQNHVWIAEVTNGGELELKHDLIPLWFQKSVWSKFKAGQ